MTPQTTLPLDGYKRAAVAEILTLRVCTLGEELAHGDAIFAREAFAGVDEAIPAGQTRLIEALATLLPALRAVASADSVTLPYDEAQTRNELGSVLHALCGSIEEHEDEAADFGRAIEEIAELRATLTDENTTKHPVSA